MIGQGLELSQTERLACADPLPPGMRSKPHPNQMLKCPRCDSPDTKFCYYNNYSMTQPRYFCKNCKRYWTEGGALRNVPVGGGLRKNKRSKNKTPSISSSSSSSSEQHHAGVGLHMDGPHLKDYSSFGASHGSPPHDPSEMVNFRYTASTPFPDSFNSRIYETGEQPTSMHSFGFNDMRASPQLYTGYNHLGTDGVRQSVEGGYGGYDYVGLLRGEQGQATSGQASPAAQLISNVGLHHQSIYDRADNGGEGAGLPTRFSYEVGKPYVQDSSRLGREDQEQEGHDIHPCSNELMLLQDSNKGMGGHGGCEEGVTDDGVSVNYPFDWQQVSEGLFGGTGDFYFMSSGGGGSGTGAAPSWSSFTTGTGTGTT